MTFKECELIKGKLKLDMNEICEFKEIPATELRKYSGRDFYIWAVNNKVLQIRKIDGRCIFLKNNKCEIYPIRPYVCRLFPFWFDENGEPIFSVGREICPIGDDELIMYMSKNYKLIKRWIDEYKEFIEDYKHKIDKISH